MIEIFSNQPFWLVMILLPLKIWACWEAAQKDQLGWFVLFFLTWLYAIPEIIYLVWFRKNRWQEQKVYKVCDSCSELFLESEDHSFFEGFGFVCFLCLDEGFKLPESINGVEEAKSTDDFTSQVDETPFIKFPKINLNS